MKTLGQSQFWTYSCCQGWDRKGGKFLIEKRDILAWMKVKTFQEFRLDAVSGLKSVKSSSLPENEKK